MRAEPWRETNVRVFNSMSRAAGCNVMLNSASCRPGAAGRAGARKGSRKKPKLTVEDLTTKPMGFAYLLTDLADDFRKVYKGPGHEVTHSSHHP